MHGDRVLAGGLVTWVPFRHSGLLSLHRLSFVHTVFVVCEHCPCGLWTLSLWTLSLWSVDTVLVVCGHCPCGL